MTRESYHDPVLVEEITALLVRKPGIYVDGTLGGGGHALAILRALHAAGYGGGSLLIGIDQDDEALKAAAEKLSEFEGRTALVQGNFQEIEAIIKRVSAEKGLPPKAEGILLDLGVSSFQIDTPERGFSYLRQGPLDMRMDRGASLSARELVNSLDERELSRIIFRYGEEPRSRSISRAIVAHRLKHGPIETTGELALIIRAISGRETVIKTLSRVFQALRIEVNRELEVLREALSGAVASLDEGGRMAVISYHSLEDRIVKTVFAAEARSDWGPKGVGLREPVTRGIITAVTRKPMLATPEEIDRNPRARSAKLRVIEKI
ncbi:MAG: 16S rRNA (cytosine(1402)-N(4))-methyltransferase RsmH [Chlorobiaceae bacterium]